MRKFLFVGLLVMMVFSANIFAQFAGGSGTSADPYLVETAEHLNNVRNYLNNSSVYFKQIADIDLDIAPYNEVKDGNL